MAWKLKKTVVLVGMMGSGKSAVGKALASMLGVALRDSDAEIEAAAAMSIAEIFARDGEAFFRQRETEVIGRLLDGAPCVLSTGGGAFLAERNRQMISQRGVSLWLDADIDILWNRVRHRSHRPLLQTANPRATLEDIFNQRVPIYAKADLSVKACATYAVTDMARQVLTTLQTRPDVLEPK